MDPLSALLDPAGCAFDLRLRGSWSLTAAAGAELTVVAVLDGTAWCHRDAGDAVLLEAGDLVLVRPQARRAFAASADACPSAPASGWSTDGEHPEGETRLVVRSVPEGVGSMSAFFDTLAPQHVLGTARDSVWWTALREEADHVSVGRLVSMARILDLLVVDAVRRWIADGEARGWMRAVLDPYVGAALRLFHENPGYPWTLQEVAGRVGTSRSGLSRRFQILVGESPMTYLREWRLTRAASLLAEEGTTVSGAARRSGFGDPFAFSAAFSKKFGVAPRHYRSRPSAGSA